MSAEVRMPRLSSTAEEATVVRWHKRPGEPVRAGEVLVEIETDKATMEVEAPESGVVVELLVGEGESAPVGAPIARIATGATPAASPAATPSPAPAPAPAPPTLTTAPPAAAEARRADAAAGPQPLSPMRRGIAEVVRRSWAEIPSFWVERWVATEALSQALETLNRRLEGQGLRLTVTDFMLQALADVLPAHPSLRSRWVELGAGSWGRQVVERIDVGLMVSVPPEGLLLVVLKDLGGKSLPEIARLRREAVELARAGRLVASDGEPTLSLSNLGPEGPDRFRAIIYPGQVGIVAAGRLHQRAVARQGTVVVEQGLYLNLTVDHRLVDGVEAARFLANLARRLEQGPWNPAPAS